MVSQDSPSNSNSSILHQFIISAQNQYANRHYDHAYAADFSDTNSHQPLGLLPNIQSLGDRMSRSVDLVHAPQIANESEVNQGRNFMDLLGAASDEANFQAQRLSLSLGSRALVSPVQCSSSFTPNLINAGYVNSGAETGQSCTSGVLDRLPYEYSFAGSCFSPSSTSGNQSCSTLYERDSFAAAISNSKFLKPAQSLLEEMINVAGKTVNLSNEKYVRKLSRSSRRGSLGLGSELKAELSSIELISGRHELHVKLAKLIALLEEVEIRYEKYYNHLEEVVSSFEMIAGIGAGKSYTGLALQAMSRHFCSLRDAIVSQIFRARQKMCQDMPKVSNGMSKLSLFDKESRQNRVSLQQLGMIQCSRHAWRPIRGLPETSVTILRSWLFEHFLHPYPNDCEKLMLASQTGLTKNQVSNWFINARVRLWKPMIEEMYKDEFAESSNESDTLLREGVSDSAED